MLLSTVGASVSSKQSFPKFIPTASKLYLLEDTKELDKLKLAELYEEVVVNCFPIRGFERNNLVLV